MLLGIDKLLAWVPWQGCGGFRRHARFATEFLQNLLGKTSSGISSFRSRRRQISDDIQAKTNINGRSFGHQCCRSL